MQELKDALATGKTEEIRHEIGDLLFTVVNVCRFLDVDAEAALRETIGRFSRRFEHIERAMRSEGKPMKDATIEELEERWQAAKEEVQKIS